jgi:hypothetical protein
VPECYQPSKKHEAFPLPAKCKDSLKKSKLPGFISLGIRALFVPDQKTLERGSGATGGAKVSI